MDRLEHMFELQNGLQEHLGTWNKIKNESDKQQFLNQQFLAMIEETVEIMRETPYKSPSHVPFGWKHGQIGNRDKVLEETVDLIHFIMNVCLVNGFSAEDVYQSYCAKREVNKQRKDTGY